MFPSLSRTTPQTQVSTSFVAERAMTIAPQTSFLILVNGNPAPAPTSVTVRAGDTVTAVVTSPDDYVWHQFYYYTIDSVPQTFAVVNKSLYQAHVKPADAILRWYIYPVTTHSLTFQTAQGVNYPVNLGSKFDVIAEDVHVVLDPISESVYFYNHYGIQLSKVTLPAAPIAYTKVPDRQSLVVLILGGEAYEIYLNSSSNGIAPFFARRNYSEFVDTTYITQLPGEDLITYLRRARARKTIPPATCITYNGTHLWAAGNGSIWVVDPADNFRLLHTYDIDEYVFNIAPLPNNQGAVLVCQSQKVYTIDYSGTLTQIYRGTAVWEPALFNGKIYIPESEVGYLKVYNPQTKAFEADIDLNGFSPSYTTIGDGKLFVCGHDNETVLVFDANMNQSKLTFPSKVTWLSAVNDTYIASHWLKDIQVLSQLDLFRIVGINFRHRSGPITHIGTDESLVVPLGNSEVMAHTPNNAWLWVNGLRTYSNNALGTALHNGDYISLNYSARVAGKSRTNCVIGDTAYDYDIEAFAETYFPRNIDLPIGAPQFRGVHTRTITLPRFFTPCRMSIEFGSIKVNDIMYYGDALVNPGDVVVVEINTRGNSALPVFTIGARQFVIPVSISGNTTPILSQQTNLQPATPVDFKVTMTELSSQYDYIIPGYYDIVVKKNKVDITGNYYQQFGKGDELIVEFISSAKLYDVRDVYILGVDNYKFTARNKVPSALSYLDYGTLVAPYARQLDNQFINQTAVVNSMNVEYYEEPTIQFTTANLTVSGLEPNIAGNLSVLGGDSYLILNGNLIQDTANIIVQNGDQLALARNVVNYFDVPVKVVQSLPTGDEDGYTDVEVGIWRITNRDIEPVKSINRSTEDVTAVGAITETGTTSNFETVKSAYELSRLPQRKIFSPRERTESTYFPRSRATQPLLTYETPCGTTAANIEMDPSGSTLKGSNHLEFDKNAALYDTSFTVEYDNENTPQSAGYSLLRSHQGERKIFAYTLTLDYEQYGSERGYSLDLDKVPLLRSKGPVLVFDRALISTADSSLSEIDKASDAPAESYTIQFDRPVGRTIFSSSLEFVRPIMFVEYGARTVNSVQLSNKTLDGYVSNNYVTADSISEAATVVHQIDTMFVELGATVQHGNISSLTGQMGEAHFVSAEGDKLKAAGPKLGFETYTLEVPHLPLLDESGDPVKMTLDHRFDNYSLSLSRVNNWQDNIDNLSIGLSIQPTALEEFDRYIRIIPPSATTYRYSTGTNTPIGTGKKNVILNSSDPAEKTDIHYTNTAPSAPLQFINTYQSPYPAIIPIKIDFNDFVPALPTVPFKSLTQILGASNAAPLKFNSRTGDAVNTDFVKREVASTNSITIPDAAIYQNTPVTLEWEKVIQGTANKIDSKANLLAAETYIINPGAYQALEIPKVVDRTDFVVSVEPQGDQVIAVYQSERLADPIRIALPYVNEDTNHDVYLPMQWVTIDDVPAGYVGMEYEQEDLRLHTSQLGFRREREYPGITAHIDSEQYRMGQTGTVQSIIEQDHQDVKQYFKIKWERERPQYYYMRYLTAPEFDQGEVWENEIETVYGAFATIKDAEEAAKHYQAFRPYLILDTNLWTYRVLLDTGLVCPLPKGRYPIAWLLRGG